MGATVPAYMVWYSHYQENVVQFAIHFRNISLQTRSWIFWFKETIPASKVHNNKVVYLVQDKDVQPQTIQGLK